MLSLYDSCVDGIAHAGEQETGVRLIDILTRGVEAAYDTVTMLRDSRETYGLTIAPTFMLQQAALTVFFLIKAAHLDPALQVPHPRQGSTPATLRHAAALEEVFRCLLAFGVQIMFSRGVVRMAYRTAWQLEVQLPDLVHRMIRLAGDTAWRSGDAHGFQSIYPNLAMHEASNAEKVDMEAVLLSFENAGLDDKEGSE